MGFLDRAIRRGISEGVSRGVSKAVGEAVNKVVEPKATDLANKAAQHIDNATGNMHANTTYSNNNGSTASALDGAFANLQRSATAYATEAAKNIKTCPACGESTSADKSFCPSCGAKLPEKSIAEELVCTSCGTQNSVGTKFCQKCGAKLPFALAEEQRAKEKDEATLNKFREQLPQFPVWNCGGTDFCLETEYDYCYFTAVLENNFQAQGAVERYRQLALQNGFRQAGQYPSAEHLYKRIDGVVYHIDTEHCFEGDSNRPTVYFNKAEPTGGFDYVKPEPKKKTGFFDLFK